MSQYDIAGVTTINGPHPWPFVGIMAVTHGDEPAGWSAHAFLKEYFQTHPLSWWRIFLVEGNPEAAKQWRICIDENLNRIFQDDAKLSEKQKLSKEYQRSRMLMPLLSSLDYLLDIHSTNNPWPVFSILKMEDAIHERMASCLPIEFYSYGWGSTIVGTTCDWVDASGGVGITIECGDHNNPQGWRIAIEATQMFLQNIWMHDFWITITPQSRHLEVLYKEEVCDKETFHYTKPYVNFESVAVWEIIAQDTEKSYTMSTENGVIIFPTKIESIRSGAIREAYLIGKFH